MPFVAMEIDEALGKRGTVWSNRFELELVIGIGIKPSAGAMDVGVDLNLEKQQGRMEDGTKNCKEGYRRKS